MKKVYSIFLICLVTTISAQQEKENGPNAKQNDMQILKSIEQALNEIDSTLSSVALKIDNKISDTTNYVKLRRSLDRINQSFLQTTQKIDQKLTEILPEFDDKGRRK